MGTLANMGAVVFKTPAPAISATAEKLEAFLVAELATGALKIARVIAGGQLVTDAAAPNEPVVGSLLRLVSDKLSAAEESGRSLTPSILMGGVPTAGRVHTWWNGYVIIPGLLTWDDGDTAAIEAVGRYQTPPVKGPLGGVPDSNWPYGPELFDANRVYQTWFPSADHKALAALYGQGAWRFGKTATAATNGQSLLFHWSPRSEEPAQAGGSLEGAIAAHFAARARASAPKRWFHFRNPSYR